MKIRVISFTKNGIERSKQMLKLFPKKEIVLYTKCSAYRKRNLDNPSVRYVEETLGDWTSRQFERKDTLFFIGACGIAVRAIAPFVESKLSDSPVLVMDELGRFIIPMLSGHVGGANELAQDFAERMGATAVITTATDLNQKFAVDLFAKRNQFHIGNKEGIVKVSSKVLAGQEITMSIHPRYVSKEAIRLPEGLRLVAYPPKEKVDVLISEENSYESELWLLPKEYVFGIGCRKGKEEEKIADLIEKHLAVLGITVDQVCAFASIDLKREEPGLLLWSQKNRIPFHTYSAEELSRVDGTFSRSEFVQATTGVENVCERAALKESGEGGVLVYPKHAEDGMTIAVARRKRSVQFDEK